jgi:acyl-CoA thioester hydrolase
MMGAWMDLNTRKLIALPDEIHQLLDAVERPEDFKVLTKEDTRKFAKTPVDLEQA